MGLPAAPVPRRPRLSDRQWARLRRLFASDDPTGQILGAWAGKELLRQLLIDLDAGARPYEIRARLNQFYHCAAQEDIPELTTLAITIETWWPEILTFLQLRITNALTKGYNRTIKTIKRLGCGFRNEASYRQRIMLHPPQPRRDTAPRRDRSHGLAR